MAINLSSVTNQVQQSISQTSSVVNTVSGVNQAVNSINSLPTSLGPLSGDISGIANSIDSAVGAATSEISDFQTNVSGGVNQVVQNIANQLNAGPNAVLTSLGQTNNILGETTNSLLGGFDNITGEISNALSQGISSSGILDSVNSLSGFTNQAFGAIGGITDFASDFSGTVDNISDSVNSTINQTLNSIGSANAGLNQITATVSNISNLGNNLTTNFDKIPGNFVSKGLSNLTGDISGKVNDLTQGINTKISDVTGDINGVISKVDNVVSTVDSVSGLLSNPGKIAGALQETVGNLVNAGLSSLLDPINRIVGFATNLINQISLIPGSISDLIGDAVSGVTSVFEEGGITDLFKSFGGTNSGKSQIPDDLKTTGIDGSEKMLNPLRNFNHYNYVFTLGVLTKNEANLPGSTYRGSGDFSVTILKSGGGGYEKRASISDEDDGENTEFLEYFIDDVEIDSIVAPNPNTGLTMGTNISFKVIEPYSMGKFIETLAVSSLTAGHDNHLVSPYCFKIEFKGWDEYGKKDQSTNVPPRYVPFQITNMDFNVTEQGSVYDISAITISDLATEAKTVETKTQIEAGGTTVAQILTTTEGSISRALNGFQEEAEDKDVVKQYDRYIVVFPKEEDSIMKALEERQSVGAVTKTATEELQNRTGNPSIRGSRPELKAQVPNPTGIYGYLKAWMQDENNINDLGKSKLIEQTTDGSDTENINPSTTWDPELKILSRNVPEATVSSFGRTVKFNSGTSIITMIEEVLKNSKVIRNSTDIEKNKGRKQYFRLETLTFYEDNPEAEEQLNRPPRTYVYAVHPYFPDESKFTAGCEVAKNESEIRAQSFKEYNYYYTGRNEDIIDFDVNFNYSFFQTVLADFGNLKTDLSTSIAKSQEKPGSNVSPDSQCKKTIEPDTEGKAQVQTTERYEYASNSGMRNDLSRATKKAVTEQLHDRIINSPIDMITADMEIWGDPYFIPTDLGNYQTVPIGQINKEGAYKAIRNVLDVIINFRTPLDYKVNGFVMDFPELTKPFSGIYMPYGITNKFSGGKFTQELKMTRRQGYGKDATGTKGPMVETQSEGLGADKNPNLKRASAGQTPLGGTAITGFPPQNVDPNITSPGQTPLGGSAITGAPSRLQQQLSAEQNVNLDAFGGSGAPVITLDAFGGSGSNISRPPVSNTRVNVNSIPNIDTTLDARANRTRTTGILPSGFNSVRIPGL